MFLIAAVGGAIAIPSWGDLHAARGISGADFAAVQQHGVDFHQVITPTVKSSAKAAAVHDSEQLVRKDITQRVATDAKARYQSIVLDKAKEAAKKASNKEDAKKAAKAAVKDYLKSSEFKHGVKTSTVEDGKAIINEKRPERNTASLKDSCEESVRGCYPLGTEEAINARSRMQRKPGHLQGRRQLPLRSGAAISTR